ncbi:ferredoxin--NADP reductase [Litorivivens sp.]|uniref:ferredoxin--NADP reductase n=1 Tax=Litorivivens sp. TaxID=2020868 RepID=UPI0035655035
MTTLATERVTDIHHWNERLFSFKTSRDTGLRFENGHFVMIGLPVEGKPLLRAYSIVSANYDEELEFLSIKVPDGPLTSRLQNINVGDEIFVSRKPTGTLVADHLLPGRNLYMFATGTGLAPFMSIVKDPEVYERFDRIILCHGVRYASELAYADFLTDELPQNAFFGEQVQEKLIYFPTVTREPFRNQGRLTDLLASGALFDAIGLPAPNKDDDRFMLCGSPGMLKDMTALLDERGFKESRNGYLGEYVIERAFVEK